jgi:hypothetical protein
MKEDLFMFCHGREEEDVDGDEPRSAKARWVVR